MNLNGFVNTPTFLKLIIHEKAVTLIIFIQCLCKNMQMLELHFKDEFLRLMSSGWNGKTQLVSVL